AKGQINVDVFLLMRIQTGGDEHPELVENPRTADDEAGHDRHLGPHGKTFGDAQDCQDGGTKNLELPINHFADLISLVESYGNQLPPSHGLIFFLVNESPNTELLKEGF